MVTWLARKARETDPRQVCVLDRADRPRWQALWDRNPNITRNPNGAQLLRDGPGVRHYIANKTPDRWKWIEVPDREPGDLYLKSTARRIDDPYIYVEPNIKDRASVNKRWPHYQAVVDALPEFIFAQCTAPYLRGVVKLSTPDVVDALSVLSHASLYVGNEGGMHHAAAALGVPAVVIFGGYISPAVTGYKEQTNLYAGGDPCGMRVPCRHCVDAMNSITVDMVVQAIEDTLCSQDD